MEKERKREREKERKREREKERKREREKERKREMRKKVKEKRERENFEKFQTYLSIACCNESPSTLSLMTPSSILENVSSKISFF
jgi:hypothetical protein